MAVSWQSVESTNINQIGYDYRDKALGKKKGGA